MHEGPVGVHWLLSQDLKVTSRTLGGLGHMLFWCLSQERFLLELPLGQLQVLCRPAIVAARDTPVSSSGALLFAGL